MEYHRVAGYEGAYFEEAKKKGIFGAESVKLWCLCRAAGTLLTELAKTRSAGGWFRAC